MHDIDRDSIGAHLHQRRVEGFQRALHVRLEDYAELRYLFRLHFFVQLFERQTLGFALVRLTALKLALRDEVARLPLRRERGELLSRLRHVLKAEYLDRHTGAG